MTPGFCPENRMLKRISLPAFALVVSFAANGSSLAAQNAYVYYTHKPGDTTSNPRLTFVTSGERVDRNGPQRHLGQPPMLQVPRGSQACIVVEDANPLLYDYKLESKTIVIAAPEGYGDILSGLAGAVFGIHPSASAAPQNKFQAFTASVPPPADAEQLRNRYANDINGIIQAGQALDSPKQASDSGEIDYPTADPKNDSPTHSQSRPTTFIKQTKPMT